MQGETGCNTELNCNLELPGKADDCDEIYLTISDGVGGMQKYCGKTALKNIQPSGGEFRDLFVDATYAEKSKWSCTASCSSKGIVVIAFIRCIVSNFTMFFRGH